MLLRSFCGYYSLRTGSLIIIVIVFSFQSIVCIDIIVGFLLGSDNLILSTVELVAQEDSDKVLGGTFLSMFVTGTGFYGIVKKKPKKIEKHLTLQVLYLVLIAGAVCITGKDEELKIEMICVLVISFGVLLYFWLVVFSYYRELKRYYKKNSPSTDEGHAMTTTSSNPVVSV